MIKSRGDGGAEQAGGEVAAVPDPASKENVLGESFHKVPVPNPAAEVTA